MSVTNPPTGASGPGSVGLGAVRGSLKRSVQASFEGESVLFSCLIILIFWVCHISRAYIASKVPCLLYRSHCTSLLSRCMHLYLFRVHSIFTLNFHVHNLVISYSDLLFLFLSSFSSYLKCPFFCLTRGLPHICPKREMIILRCRL